MIPFILGIICYQSSCMHDSHTPVILNYDPIKAPPPVLLQNRRITVRYDIHVPKGKQKYNYFRETQKDDITSPCPAQDDLNERSLLST